MEQRTIAVLGATGSVGTQALDVIRAQGLRTDLLTAGTNVAAAETLCRRYRPRFFAMADRAAAEDLSVRVADLDVRVLAGEEGILEGISLTRADTVVNAILGCAGLLPTLAVIDAGKRLALANKESLVIAGDTVMTRAADAGAEVLPVDSEHCAIFQCLHAGEHAEVSRLLLTASGGPFRSYTPAELQNVTLEKTLAHPTWKMGKKITVDSATLMNKGFEVLEASHLFGIPTDRIEVVVHPESIIHSAVEYIDNTVIAEMSVPDMRMCVQYAIDYPKRTAGVGERLDLFSVGKLTFERPRTDAFPLLDLAVRVGAMGGGMGAVLNAADEVAVDAFLGGRMSFARIAPTVCRTVDALCAHRADRTVEEFLAADAEARAYATSIL